MAVIKRADAERRAHRPVSLDLGDLDRRGQMLREAAVAEAERIVREAHAERDRLLSDATEVGLARGHAEGLAAGTAEGREAGKAEAVAEFRERLGEMDSAWAAEMATFLHRREALLTEAKRAVIELAVAIAERIVHRQIEIDPTLVQDQLRDLLGLVTAPATLVVRVHPEDEPLVEAVLPRLREQLSGTVHVRFEPDPEVARGACHARTLGGASIDAGIATQLDRVVRDLLPDRVPAGRRAEPDVAGGADAGSSETAA
ncbi:MAG: FliH/SctL family protein [Phycisphaerales bacterium JB054]